MPTSSPSSFGRFPKSGELLRAGGEALRAKVPRSLHRSAVDWTDTTTLRRGLEGMLREIGVPTRLKERPAPEVVHELCSALLALARRWDDIGASLHEPRALGEAASAATALAGRFLVLDLAVRTGAWMAIAKVAALDEGLVNAYAEGFGFATWLRRKSALLGWTAAKLAREARTSAKTVGGWRAKGARARLPRTRFARDLAVAFGEAADADAAHLETRVAIAFAEVFGRCASIFGAEVASSWARGFAEVANEVRSALVDERVDPWPVLLDGAHAQQPPLIRVLTSLALRATSYSAAYAVLFVLDDWRFATGCLLRGMSVASRGRSLHVTLKPLSGRRRTGWTGMRFGRPFEFTDRSPQSGELLPLLLAQIRAGARREPDRFRDALSVLGNDAASALGELLVANLDAAATLATRARSSDPQNRIAALVLSDVQLRRGRPEEALRALKGLPDDEAAAWLRRGLALREAGKLRSAEKALHRAEALGRDDPMVIRALATTLGELSPREAVPYRRRAKTRTV